MKHPQHVKNEDFDAHIWAGFGPKVRAILAAANRPDLEDAVKQRLRDFPAWFTTESIVDYVIGKAVEAEVERAPA